MSEPEVANDNLLADDELTTFDDKPKLLHIYGQESHHDEVSIVGNRAALENLRQIIDNVLCRPDYAHSMEAYVSDGEGYDLRVFLMEGNWDTATWQRLAVPYYGEYASEKREWVIKPWRFQ